MHRLLPPSAIAGVSLGCALGPWLFSQPTVLRTLAAIAAATAAVGAAVMRRWDSEAGKQVADLSRARASDEWRHEERIAELETDLEESRELRAKLEQRLRAKRSELAGLRNEHASLLRRYATAETERASALEGRRLLEIEAAEPSNELSAAPEADAAEESAAGVEEKTGAKNEAKSGELTVEETVPAIFSPEGSKLFLRAKVALARFDEKDIAKNTAKDIAKDGTDAGTDAEGSAETAAGPGTAPTGETAPEDEAQGQPEAADGHTRAVAASTAGPDAGEDTAPAPAEQDARPSAAPSAKSVKPSGHFTVPTAVAVLPAAPIPRPLVTGGFDFFGTQKGSPAGGLDTVHNEDLADVVGQEALALHKAESEAEFKPADAQARGVGQVIDLTAHDETEQINLGGLRSAAS
ncbi:hypothetical protein AB0E08_09275 [Streptomyces sp. NPDC048281]|uniref:hypothetical protein n=1 Tax=Streptomyces sp. NPDC048281 TaxID=3154715 RepID=UPI0034214FC1